MNVLIIEDERFTRTIIAEVLEQWGYKVWKTASAAEAWECARRHPPSVVIADLDLGNGPTGLDAVQVLRQDDPSLPVVILTNHRSPHLIQNDPPELDSSYAYLVKSDIRSAEDIQNAILSVVDNRVQPPQPQEVRPSLTKTQAEILRLMAQGMTNEQIAETRFSSKRSVELCIQRTYQALGLTDKNSNARVTAVNMYQNSEITVK